MRRAILALTGALALAAMAGCAPGGMGPGDMGPSGLYEVTGVEGDDMLKLRAGPGTGFRVIVGVPNGTVLRVGSCDRTGGTRWCRVSLREARGLQGHVSYAYLRRL